MLARRVPQIKPHEANQLMASWAVMASRAEAIAWMRLGWERAWALLSRRRDMAAAKRFFFQGNEAAWAPRVITLDGYAASHRAVVKLKTSGILARRVQVRSCKYLNNVIEQDHRQIKQRI